jgi:hypothetical protein
VNERIIGQALDALYNFHRIWAFFHQSMAPCGLAWPNMEKALLEMFGYKFNGNLNPKPLFDSEVACEGDEPCFLTWSLIQACEEQLFPMRHLPTFRLSLV